MHSRPSLPTADKLLPYLKRIDEARYYSNTGPLVLDLEKRLSEHFGCGVVTASSCTSGLTACLVAQGLPEHSLVAVNSWTFVASVSAIIAAGHRPYFVDIPDRLMTDGTDFRAFIAAPMFGRPIEGMDKARLYLGRKPVIIDAAAAFDTIKPSECPQVISTHATKVFSTGEGGLILSKDDSFLKTIREILNFGIDENRDVNYFGFNGKMSEYAAAVGLAELDGWHEKKERWIDTKRRYKKAFPEYRCFVDGEWASNVYPVILDSAVLYNPAALTAKKMSKKGFLCRMWTPVHHLKAYQHFPRTDMRVTDELAEKTILLPFSIDSMDEEIGNLREALCAPL